MVTTLESDKISTLCDTQGEVFSHDSLWMVFVQWLRNSNSKQEFPEVSWQVQLLFGVSDWCREPWGNFRTQPKYRTTLSMTTITPSELKQYQQKTHCKYTPSQRWCGDTQALAILSVYLPPYRSRNDGRVCKPLSWLSLSSTGSSAPPELQNNR